MQARLIEVPFSKTNPHMMSIFISPLNRCEFHTGLELDFQGEISIIRTYLWDVTEQKRMEALISQNSAERDRFFRKMQHEASAREMEMAQVALVKTQLDRQTFEFGRIADSSSGESQGVRSFNDPNHLLAEARCLFPYCSRARRKGQPWQSTMGYVDSFKGIVQVIVRLILC